MSRRKIVFRTGVALLLVFLFHCQCANPCNSFTRYGLHSRTSEAKTVLGGIRTAQEEFESEYQRYATVAAAGGGGDVKRPWDAAPCSKTCTSTSVESCASFDCIGYRPSGQVYYLYACNAVTTGSGAAARSDFTCAAVGDLDGDGRKGLFVYGTGHGSLDGRIVAPVPDIATELGRCAADGVRAGETVDCWPKGGWESWMGRCHY